MLRKILYIILTMFLSSLSLSSHSKECSGTWSNTVKMVDTIDLGEGVTLTVLSTRGTTSSTNSNNNGVGGCGVLVLTLPNGKTMSKFSCYRKTPEGIWTDVGGQDVDAKEGYWKFVEGTNFFKGFKGEGTWDTLTADSETSQGTWKGDCSK